MSAINRRVSTVATTAGTYTIEAVPFRIGQWGWRVTLDGAQVARSGKHHVKAAGVATQRGKRWVTGDLALRGLAR